LRIVKIAENAYAGALRNFPLLCLGSLSADRPLDYLATLFTGPPGIEEHHETRERVILIRKSGIYEFHNDPGIFDTLEELKDTPFIPRVFGPLQAVKSINDKT
jgi:hypothetical protein